MTNLLTVTDATPTSSGADSGPRQATITASIDVQYGCMQGLGPALTAVVRRALADASGVPDVVVRFAAHDPVAFVVPPSFIGPPRYGPLFTLVRVAHRDGTTAGTRNALHLAVVAAICSLGIPREEILILALEAGQGAFSDGDHPTFPADRPGFHATPSAQTGTIL